MSAFETQSQWENEQEQVFEETEDPEEQKIATKKISIKKSSIIIVCAAFVVAVSAILVFYFNAASLEGTWVRQVDDSSLEGMMVQVTNNNGVLVGTVISTGTAGANFEVNQIKWSNIQKVGFGKYECYDLMYSQSLLGGTSYYYDDAVAIINVSTNGKTLTLHNTKADSQATGLNQLWIKVK